MFFSHTNVIFKLNSEYIQFDQHPKNLQNSQKNNLNKMHTKTSNRISDKKLNRWASKCVTPVKASNRGFDLNREKRFG